MRLKNVLSDIKEDIEREMESTIYQTIYQDQFNEWSVDAKTSHPVKPLKIYYQARYPKG